MPRFIAIDLAQLPPPQAVVPPVLANLVAARKKAVLDRIDDPALKAEVAAVLALESSPLTMDAEAGAYRETLVYTRINEAVQAVLLPSSQGADLDNLASRLDVYRMTIRPADPTTTPPTPAVMEDDASLRYRYQLAPEAFSVAGPYGAYEYVARSAHPEVLDAAIYGPESGLVTPGQTLTVLLSRLGDGTPSLDVLNAVTVALNDADTVPDTDQPLIRGANIVPYGIRYRLQIQPGADPTLIVNAAIAALTQYAAAAHKVGHIIAVSALDSAAHQDRVNVVRALLLSPPGEIDPGPVGATWCTSVLVDYEIIG